jgi:general secretion pathway protein B
MSFILDALKKSENERQRQSGPALFEVKVPAPKARWPAWAFALAALLAVNIGVVCWLMLRQPSPGQAHAAPLAQTQTAAPTAAPVQAAVPPAAAAVPVVQPPVLAAEIPPSVAPAPVGDTATEELNPDDYEPATEPPAIATTEPTAEARVTRGTIEGLPTYEQIASTPGNGLPELRLDLHVYAAKPQERFIFLNMHRLREGDALPEGVRVDSITADGAVLSFRGSKFVLKRD